MRIRQRFTLSASRQDRENNACLVVHVIAVTAEATRDSFSAVVVDGGGGRQEEGMQCKWEGGGRTSEVSGRFLSQALHTIFRTKLATPPE